MRGNETRNRFGSFQMQAPTNDPNTKNKKKLYKKLPNIIKNLKRKYERQIILRK